MKSFNRSALILTLTLLCSSLLLFSCSSKALVALTNTENIQVGKIYKFKGETFKKEGSQTVSYYRAYDKENDKIFQEKKAFFQFCNNKKELNAFLTNFEPYKNLYAKSTATHYIRSSRSSNAPNPYRMRFNEEVKVISIDKEEVEIDGKRGHWVEVLSNDGYRGFSFDFKLEIIDKVQEELNKEKISSNRKLLQLLSNRFYPDYYQDMIDENRIDLNEINETNGFYYNAENNIIVLKTADTYKTFNPDQIKGTSEKDFVNQSIGLVINILAPNHLFLVYEDKGETKRFDLYQLKDVPEIAIKELENRQNNLTQIIEMGGSFDSSSYGNLTITPDSKFIWTGYERLIPNLIPQNAGTTGTLSFDLYLTKALERKYTDAIYFNFKYGNKVTSIPFFISIMPEKKAIRLISVPRNLVNPDRLIKNDTPSPIIIHFQAGANN